jgi:putative transposase
VLNSQGKTVARSVRAIEVTEATYGGRREEDGGLKVDQVRWLKELDRGLAS